jgi:hypothetical protein
LCDADEKDSHRGSERDDRDPKDAKEKPKGSLATALLHSCELLPLLTGVAGAHVVACQRYVTAGCVCCVRRGWRFQSFVVVSCF